MKSLSRSMMFLLLCTLNLTAVFAQERSHPRLMASPAEIDTAKQWIQRYPWYRMVFEEHKKEIDAFIAHGPIYVSPLKQTYVWDMYTCPKHRVDLMYEVFKPFEHRCPKDTTEVYKGGKFDMAWAGWYNRLLASHLVWMGLLHNVYGGDQYAEAGKSILMQFADIYTKLPTGNTILGPAHVFFGTLSESFWGVDMAYGYDLLYYYKGFTDADRRKLKDSLFYPLADITQQFPESASNRQCWYNNVSAAVGFLYDDRKLVDFAMDGRFGFTWQLGSALPESGFWPEWSGYHFVTLRGMIHLAEMARHNGHDLYHMEIAGRSMKKMFDSPFNVVKPNFEFPRCKDSGGGSLLEYAPYYEVGYAVYREPKYLALLNLTNLQRGTQLVGESSALGKVPEPVTIFNLVPDIPRDTMDVYVEESVNLEGNGFAILRGKDPRTYLYLDYGILGGEHGHPDRLQIGYFADGRNWIVDPLNESYANPNLQHWFRHSIAHNTLVVDQTTQTWTNGYGNFFGALPEFQVASGGSTTEYPGVKLTRTVLQVGSIDSATGGVGGYFLDLFDAAAPEVRMYDLPLHGFGGVNVSGVRLHPQPIDFFGNKPGIPGYDQLTDIFSGRTDSAWQGIFTDKGKQMSVMMLGEPGTEVFSTMTPPIGGFYKQMVSEQVPMPMVMGRRTAKETRFVSLIEAYTGARVAQGIARGNAPGSYVVRRRDGRDIFHMDLERSRYFLIRKKNDREALLAGFNVQEVRDDSRDGDRVLFSSLFPLSEVQCRWDGQTVDVIAPEWFGRLRIHAPQASRLVLNGREQSFTKDGDYAILEQVAPLAMTVTFPNDSMLYVGRNNRVQVKIWNHGKTPVNGNVRIDLAADWKQRMESQLEWWGGIVNLLAINKTSVERMTYPAGYAKDPSWILGKEFEVKSVPPGGSETVEFTLNVPNDAAPVAYPVLVVFGRDTVRMNVTAQPPVTARMMMPNGERASLRVELENHTPDRVSVSTDLTFDRAWKVRGKGKQRVDLAPFGKKRIDVPVELAGYNRKNQYYPIRVRLEAGDFRMETERDFYVGTAHLAREAPALDGSWKGWNRSEPMLVDSSWQIARLLFGNQPWHGRRDLSAQVYAMYDSRYLYVGAEILDDSLITHWDFPRMNYPWDTDCMDVVLDVRTNSTQGYDPPTPGLFRHLSLSEYRVTDFGAVAWQGPTGPLLPEPNLVPGAETFFRRTEREGSPTVSVGYVLIARYPLASLDGIVARPGYKIGFDVAFMDNDGANYRKNQHTWAGFNKNQGWWDMGTIGALVFK